MFDSSVIDVAIGLVFVFLLLSFVASAVKEGLEALFKRRATDLEKGIKELLGSDEIGKKFIESLYNHGLINSLFAGKYGAKGAELPSYIPSKNFALALMDLRNQSQGAAPTIKLPQNVKQAIDAFEITAGKDVDKMQKQIEDWYNSSMDRVSGWYKRRTQYWLFGIGVMITIAVNVDSIAIAKRLSTDKTLREAVVHGALQESKNTLTSAVITGQTSGTDEKMTAPDTDESIKKIKANLSALDGVGLPIGWTEDLTNWNDEAARIKDNTSFVDKIKVYTVATWHLRVKTYPHLAGWLLTALAVSLGAPFWFDMLNKFMVVRSTVKPSEKSKEEGSKDHAPAKSSPPPAEQ